jgi:hypothetical protein
MGIDTRYFGPSGWQLFHLIAFRSPHPEEVLLMIKDVLPCRFCRESTAQFTRELPLKGDPGKWLYDLHNKVNHKLRTQCKDDPTIVNPGPDPSFEEVKERYMKMKPTNVPGRDFLFSVAVNYPDEPEPEQMAIQRRFLQLLADVYPFQELREVYDDYHSRHIPALENRKAYMKWMYGLLLALSKKIGIRIPSYKGYVQHTMYYKSGCAKKTYRGKTCRKARGGGLTKQRDHRKTRKMAHAQLL